MTEHSIQIDQEDAISLLDIFVTLAESWKLLVIGPLIAGLLAFGLSYRWPKTYESVAIVRMVEEEVALLHAVPVLDPLIEKFGLLVEGDVIQDDARQELKKRVTFSVDRKTRLATIIAKGHTPENAQALGRAAIDALLIELQPKGKEREAILQEIAINNQLISDGVNIFDRQSYKQSNGNSNKGQLANLKLNNLELTLKLEAKGKEVFAQEPSLPQRKISPKRSLIVLVTVSVSIFILLIFVFLRKAFSVAVKDEQSAVKLSIIKRSLGL